MIGIKIGGYMEIALFLESVLIGFLLFCLIKSWVLRFKHDKKKDTGRIVNIKDYQSKPSRICGYIGGASYRPMHEEDDLSTGLKDSKTSLKNSIKNMFADNTRDASELQWKIYEYEKAQENEKCPYKSKEELDKETEDEIKVFNQMVDLLE